ncbi:S1-C subfamily serine protease [Bradyrhizobium sp. GM5.1]
MEVDRSRFHDIVEKSRQDRDKVRTLVDDKRWREAEPDRARMAVYMARAARQRLPTGAEAIIGPDDLQASWFLPAGATARRAVGFVETTNAGSWTAGSGFLISEDLFLTNQHVIGDESVALAAQVTFDREMGDDGSLRPVTTYRLDPTRFAIFSRQEEFDYALIRAWRENGRDRGADRARLLRDLRPARQTRDRHEREHHTAPQWAA